MVMKNMIHTGVTHASVTAQGHIVCTTTRHLFLAGRNEIVLAKSDWEVWIKVAQLQQKPKPEERSNIS